MNNAEFHEWLERLNDDELSAAEREQLMSAIGSEQQKQEAFLNHYMLAAALEEQLAIDAERSPLNSRLRNWKPILPWGIAAALALFILLSQFMPDTPDSSNEKTSFLALLVNEAGAQFSDENAPDDIRFQKGNYKLKAGTIHLRFTNGADVVMKAPTAFEINDGFHMRLHHGRIWAMAPPSAQGFTVATPGVDYEDLGTEFAISVDRHTGASKLHVIDGQVDARHPDSKDLISSVTGGQSLRFANGKPEQTDTPDLKSYSTPGDIGFLRWQQNRAAFGKDDPDLIGYYPFTKSNSLLNEAADAITGNGEIHGARWVSGRWPGKQALLFDRDTDFVELDIPGKYEELSLATWVKLDRFDHSHNSIFNSNGWDAGDVHWTIHRNRSMQIGFSGAKISSSSQSLKTIPTNQWIHIASTLSLSSGKSCVYLNGELAGARQIERRSAMIRPGSGRIGNWLEGDRIDQAPMRALRGKMDELAIWKRALTEVEIKELVEAGKPSALWSIESK